MSDKPSVLFVSIHNAGRSQIAAGWLTALAGDGIEVRSADTAPADRVNTSAFDAIREVGIDITAATPKVLTDAAGQGVEAVRPIRDAIRAHVEQLITELFPQRAKQGVSA